MSQNFFVLLNISKFHLLRFVHFTFYMMNNTLFEKSCTCMIRVYPTVTNCEYKEDAACLFCMFFINEIVEGKNVVRDNTKIIIRKVNKL